MNNCGGGLRWQIWPYQDGYNLEKRHLQRRIVPAVSASGTIYQECDLCGVGREDLGLECIYAAVEENLGYRRYHY
jgi:Glycosyl hydrolase family 76.